MSFQATAIPECKDVEELRQHMQRALDDIANSFAETLALELRPSFRAPDKPREGMLVYADGTTWNPGSGEGTYEYKNGLWNPLFSATPAAVPIGFPTSYQFFGPVITGSFSATVGTTFTYLNASAPYVGFKKFNFSRDYPPLLSARWVFVAGGPSTCQARLIRHNGGTTPSGIVQIASLNGTGVMAEHSVNVLSAMSALVAGNTDYYLGIQVADNGTSGWASLYESRSELEWDIDQ